MSRGKHKKNMPTREPTCFKRLLILRLLSFKVCIFILLVTAIIIEYLIYARQGFWGPVQNMECEPT